MSEEPLSTEKDSDIITMVPPNMQERPFIFQLLITIGLLLGPIYLPIAIFFPSTIDWLPMGLELVIMITGIFILASIFSAYRRLKNG